MAPGSRFLARREVWFVLLLATLTVSVFRPVVDFDFLNFDDDLYVTQNPAVRAGLTPASVRWAFTNTESGHFHPLTWLSHQGDVTAFGLDAGAHHRTTLLLHVLAVLVCFLAWRALLLHQPGGAGIALFSAAVFAVHPLRAESAAWVATRKDVLSGLLFFSALWAWTRYARAPSRARLAQVTALYLLALLAKPTVLPFPLLLLALDAWPLHRLEGRTDLRARLREKLPLFALMLAFSAVALFGQSSAGALQSLEALSPLERVAQASAAIVAYAGRFFVPAPLSIFHPLHPLPPGVGATAALLVFASTVAVFRARGLPLPLRVGWAWFVLLLLPVCGLVQIGGQFISDRWLYLPTSGLVAGVIAALQPQLSRLSPTLRAAAATGVVLLLASLTVSQLPHYATSERVFRQALEADERNFLAHNNLGHALEARGALDEAEQHYRRSVHHHPTWPVALTNLANLCARRGEFGEAEALYRRALARQPDHASAHYNLALALAQQGRWQESLPHYARAAALRPSDSQAALGHGAALVALGELAGGDQELARAVSLEPSPTALAHHGRVLRLLGRSEEARARLHRALELEPQQPLAQAELRLLQ